MLKVEVDARPAISAAERHRLKVATAAAIALTRTAAQARREVQERMRTDFDRPTPYTLRSVKYQAASRADLTASVYIEGADKIGGNVDYSPADLLAHQFQGGRRKVKRLELYLRRAGLLVAGEYVAPGAAARLDRYGNMSRGQVNQVIAQLRIGLDPASFASKSARSRRNMRKAGRIFWSSGTAALPRGAYVDQGPPIGVRPLLMVVRTPSYRKRFDLQAQVARTFRNTFREQLELAMRQRGL